MSTLQTFTWYLRRPALYPELLRLVRDKVSGANARRVDTSIEARQWCAARAISIEAAVAAITGGNQSAVESLYPEIFAEAHARAARCPVRMGGPGGLNLLYWAAEHLQAKNVIETGVAYGWSSLALLLSLRNRSGAQLISIDMPYPNLDNDDYVGCVVTEELRQQWQLIRCADREGLPKALRKLQRLDLCHYDSDKSYAGRMWAYPLLWQAMRSDGLLISDDINDNVAFRDFAVMVQIDPMVVEFEGKYIGVLKRS